MNDVHGDFGEKTREQAIAAMHESIALLHELESILTADQANWLAFDFCDGLLWQAMRKAGAAVLHLRTAGECHGEG